MDIQVFLLQLVVILLTARLFGEAATWLRVPAVIGELCAGVVIGPSLFGFVEINTTIHLLAEIGIIMLLFKVGIETDITKLASVGIKALLVAITGVCLPFLFGFLICQYYFDLSLMVSLFIACTLTATSIGITLRILRDLGLHSSKESQIILGAAVLDDIIGIILLSMLYEFSQSKEINLWNTGKVVLFITLFFLVAPIAAKLVSHVLKKWDEKSKIPGLLPTIIVSLILFFSWLARELGAPELLGGFAAGLALSRQFFFPFAVTMNQSKEFSQRVEEQMEPIIDLFTPIFFVTIGLSLDLKSVSWGSALIWQITAALTIAAILGKLLSGVVLTDMGRLSKCIVGAAMVPRGEVGLIFANVGLTVGVFQSDIYAAIILVIAITTLLAPFSLKWLFAKMETAPRA